MQQHLQVFDAAYRGEAIDTKIPSVTTGEFNAMTSDLRGNELKSNIGLFQNNSQMAFSTDASMGQVYNATNNYEQPRNFNTVVSGETGIRRRTRPVRIEEPNMNPMIPSQGTAPRRIRLVRFGSTQHGSDEVAKDASCASEVHNSKPTTAGVRSLFD